MDDKKPKFNPPANIPITAEITFIPNSSKDYGYGETWLFNVSIDGREHIWFVDNDLQHQLSAFKKGESIVVKKEEKIAEKSGRTYFVWHVNQAIFKGGGGIAKPAPNLAKPEELETFRKNRRKGLLEAVEDVCEVEGALAQKGVYRRDLFTPETVQKYATALLIEYNKRT